MMDKNEKIDWFLRFYASKNSYIPIHEAYQIFTQNYPYELNLDERHVEKQTRLLLSKMVKEDLLEANSEPSGYNVQITLKGQEIQDDYGGWLNFLSKEKQKEFSYDPEDKYKPSQKEVLIAQLDELKTEIQKIRIGQEVIYDDLTKEIDELKALVDILGKKNFSQILKGKLVDQGIGIIYKEGVDVIQQVFSDQSLLD